MRILSNNQTRLTSPPSEERGKGIASSQLGLSVAALLAAAIPYVWSIFLAMAEVGDPPFPGDDALQRLLLIVWLLLFAVALIIPALARAWVAFFALGVVVILLTLFGLFWVLSPS